MCNIFFISKCNDFPKFEKALDLGRHRGPDHEGVKRGDDGILMGHGRLSILDLSPNGNQPMTKEDITILFNGEVYNYRELIEEHGLTPKSTGDTEVILDLYLKLGKKCFTELDGEFAIVIYNKRARQIFAVRDSFGIKPLYYAKTSDNGLIISSEIKPILEFIKPVLYHPAFNKLLKFGYPLGDETLFQGIHKFQPGSIYSCKTWGNIIEVEESIIWESPVKPTQKEMKELIKVAVIKKTASDVPISVCLSGGIDSSIITKYVSEVNPRIKTYTLGFKEDKEQIDLQNARIVSKFFNTDHTEIIISVEDALKELPNIIREMEEPSDKGSLIPTYFLSKIVKEKVTLVGEGADELFGGYKRHEQIAENFPESEKEYIEKYLDVFSMPTNPRGMMQRNRSGNDYLRFDLVTEIPDYHTNRLDKLFMNRSIEVRVPFLDKKLVSRALGVHYDEKVPNKKYLRNLFKKDLPKEVIEVKKNAFKIPYHEWVYRKEIKDELYKPNPFFPKDVVDGIYDQPEGTRNKERRIWLMYLIKIWHQTFFS